MKKWVLGLFAALFVFILSACQQEMEPIDLVVVGLGDSLTEGIGDEEKLGGYFGRFVEKLSEDEMVEEVTSYNFGKSGHRSEQLLERIKQEEEIRDALKEADIVTITIGGNNIVKVVRQHLLRLEMKPFEKEHSRYEENLQAIVKEIESLNPNASLFLGGVYNPLDMVSEEEAEFTEIIQGWNETIQQVSKQDNRTFISLEHLGEGPVESYYSTDYFHPNGIGYEVIADRFYHEVQQKLKEVFDE